jgi:serine/threonine protein kinase
MLYALLCGRLPFDEPTIAALFDKIERGAYRMPVGISKAAADLIARMLTVNPAERIKISEVSLCLWCN